MSKSKSKSRPHPPAMKRDGKTGQFTGKAGPKPARPGSRPAPAAPTGQGFRR